MRVLGSGEDLGLLVLDRSLNALLVGSDIGFRSRRRNLVERIILPVLFLQPVRCGECFRRDYRFIFTPVRQRLSDGPSRIMPRKSSDTSDRNVA